MPRMLAMAILTLGLLSLLIGSLGVAQTPPMNSPKPFMQRKLVHAQKVLEAIALEDYQRIEHHAQQLSLLSQAATWNVINTPEYLMHSRQFRRAAERMRDAAKQKNLDAATLAYVQMTLKCVECHQHVRKVKTAALPPANRQTVQTAGVFPGR